MVNTRERLAGAAPLRQGPGAATAGGLAPSGQRLATLRRRVPGTLLLAVASHLLLERVRIGPEPRPVWQWLADGALPQFALGTLVLWLVVVLLLAVLGGFWTTTALVLTTAAAVSIAHERKLEMRLEPLYPTDLPVALRVDFLAEVVGGPLVLALLGVLGGTVTVGVVLDRRSRRRRRQASAPAPAGRSRPLRRAVAAGLSGAALLHVADFHGPHNGLRAAYAWAGIEWISFDQPANYERNGVVAGMLFNLDAPSMDRPADYDEATMSAIAGEYAALAERVAETRDPGALADANVVLVLSESLSDPLRIPGVGFDDDPLPFTRELMARSTSGTVLTSAYGGGTANVEFEVLTGMSVVDFAPQMTTPFQMLLPEASRFPSVVTQLEQLGHRSLTLHPYSSVLYRRPEAYRALGFDESVFFEGLREPQWHGRNPFVTDQSVFTELVDRLRESARPHVVNVVTMQNHASYGDRYDDPVGVTGDLLGPEHVEQLGQFARGLRHSDDALRWLVEQLDTLPEKTVLLVYGDHLPGVWPEAVRESVGVRLMHETPFLVHVSGAAATTVDRGTVGPVHLVNALLDTVDAPLTPFQALLARVEEHVPARARSLVLGPDGEALDQGDLSEQAREVLRHYRLVQYDLAVGERWTEQVMLSPAPRAGR